MILLVMLLYNVHLCMFTNLYIPINDSPRPYSKRKLKNYR